MHLLIILLQQLLGMLPGSKQVPQAEVVTGGSAKPNAGEPDACLRIAMPLCGWMTPFEAYQFVPSVPNTGACARWRLGIVRRLSIAALRACRPWLAAGSVGWPRT